MNNGKDYFLSILGVSVPPELTQYDLCLQNKNESKPFCALLTKSDGKTVLRVNPWDAQGLLVKV